MSRSPRYAYGASGGVSLMNGKQTMYCTLCLPSRIQHLYFMDCYCYGQSSRRWSSLIDCLARLLCGLNTDLALVRASCWWLLVMWPITTDTDIIRARRIIISGDFGNGNGQRSATSKKDTRNLPGCNFFYTASNWVATVVVVAADSRGGNVGS